MSKRGYDNDRGDDGFKRARPFDGPQIRVLIPRTVGTFCSGLSIKVLSEHFGLTLRNTDFHTQKYIQANKKTKYKILLE